jgi:ABC-2 type transport system permease protein
MVARRDLTGALAPLAGGPAPFEVRVHKLYNPEGIAQHNIVPGLMGVILTMTMVMMTGLAMTRERERGTMENLLAMPAQPLEVMTGKIVPYIFIGLVQASIILLAALTLFGVPFAGSVFVLYAVSLLFIAANLTVGITISSIAQNQLQAMQLTFFFFLPTMLLSGFMFPFRGMPEWAQVLGEVFPLTHFLRIVRGIMLKGSEVAEIVPHVWPLALILLLVSAAALKRYQRTLD